MERLVQENIKITNIEIFELLIETAYKHGSLEMVLSIVDMMDEFNLKPNAVVMSYLHASIMKYNQTNHDNYEDLFEDDPSEFRMRSFLSAH